MTLLLYRILAPIIGLIFALRAIWAILRGSETWKDLRERILGPDSKGPAIWVHGASIGEMNAARPVITALAQDHRVIVTSTTTTGRATVKSWGIPYISAGLAPLDWRWVTRRMLHRNGVIGLVVIENELWPNRIAACHSTGLPVVMINARVSASSARTWNRFRNLSRSILPPMALVAPQDDESAARLVHLGVAADRMEPALNLKSQYAPDFSPIPAHLTAFDQTSTLLAAATHEGEEAIICEAFGIMRKTNPSMQLIIAPRHPVRGEAIASLMSSAGYTVAFRSSDDIPDTDVYIADTLGEMHIWYQLAGAAFIGGSMVPKGGHTPFEPAAYGCPILHGPHVENFAKPYADLDAEKGAVCVKDANELAQVALRNIRNDTLTKQAKIVLEQPDLTPLLSKIKAALNPHR